MAHAALARAKINTEVIQPARGRGTRPAAGPRKAGRPPGGPRVSGEARESARHPDRPVIELGCGILVYPPEADGEPWRAVWVSPRNVDTSPDTTTESPLGARQQTLAGAVARAGR